MRDDRVSFRVEPGLKQKFLKMARARSVPVSDLFREFMQAMVARSTRTKSSGHDQWFRGAVNEAIDDPRPAVPSEEVEAHFANRRKGSRRTFKA